MKYYWPIILAGVALALGIAFIARAQIPDHVRFEDPCVSHSGDDAMLDGFVGGSLNEWGATSSIRDCGQGTDITIRYVAFLPSGVLAQASLGWDANGHITDCIIQVSSAATNGYPLTTLYLIVGHEVGHCVGLSHTTGGDSIMMAHCCSFWTQIDRDYIAARYPQVGEPPTVEPTTTAEPTPTFVPPVPTPERVAGEPIYREWPFSDFEIPDDYNFAAVYQFVDGAWLRWASGVPAWAITLTELERGQSYYFVPWR